MKNIFFLVICVFIFVGCQESSENASSSFSSQRISDTRSHSQLLKIKSMNFKDIKSRSKIGKFLSYQYVRIFSNIRRLLLNFAVFDYACISMVFEHASV